MLNLVKTSVNTIGCFTNIRRSMPTSAVCLSTMERSIVYILSINEDLDDILMFCLLVLYLFAIGYFLYIGVGSLLKYFLSLKQVSLDQRSEKVVIKNKKQKKIYIKESLQIKQIAPPTVYIWSQTFRSLLSGNKDQSITKQGSYNIDGLV